MHRAGTLLKSQHPTHQRYCSAGGNPRLEGGGWGEAIFILNPVLEDPLLAKALGKQILSLAGLTAPLLLNIHLFHVLPNCPAPALAAAASLLTGERGPGPWGLLPFQALGKESLSVEHPSQHWFHVS